MSHLETTLAAAAAGIAVALGWVAYGRLNPDVVYKPEEPRSGEYPFPRTAALAIASQSFFLAKWIDDRSGEWGQPLLCNVIKEKNQVVRYMFHYGFIAMEVVFNNGRPRTFTVGGRTYPIDSKLEETLIYHEVIFSA